MTRNTYKVDIVLSFENLTLEETNALELFMEGLTSREEWGTPVVKWSFASQGTKDSKTGKKSVTSKDILKLEKESGGKPCGK